MEKKVRKAVRSFLIQDNQVVAIKYKTKCSLEYYDIPGGKIEEGETSEQASIREFKEETGIEIINQEYKGNVVVEYSNMIFDFDIYIVNEFRGIPIEMDENYSFWIDLDELLKQEKRFPSIEILKYLDDENLYFKLIVGEDHRIIKVEGYN